MAGEVQQTSFHYPRISAPPLSYITDNPSLCQCDIYDHGSCATMFWVPTSTRTISIWTIQKHRVL
eukprot:9101961-Pyramimonas_sp.AAC.1